MEDNDTQLHLKKRARRRLVGAVAFAGLAAVVLPMIMDQEPQPAPQDVEIRIPGQDEKPFAPKFASVPAAKPAVPEDVAPSVSAPAPAPAPAPAAPVVTAKPVEKSVEVAAKPAETIVKPPEKPAEKVVKSEKPVEKVAAKPQDKPVEKAADKLQEKSAKPSDVDAKRAAAILAGKLPEAAASAPATLPAASAQFVILIGAFADQANVKNLQGKLNELGIKVFTEPLDSPQGRKIRVRAGPFASREAAEAALEKMKRIGVTGVLAAKQ